MPETSDRKTVVELSAHSSEVSEEDHYQDISSKVTVKSKSVLSRDKWSESESRHRRASHRRHYSQLRIGRDHSRRSRKSARGRRRRHKETSKDLSDMLLKLYER